MLNLLAGIGRMSRMAATDASSPKRVCMYKRAVLIGMLVSVLLSLGGCGCGALTARDPHWRDNYKPPYMGVQHAVYSIESGDPFGGMLLVDLPATFVVGTCLLPWDLVTLIVSEPMHQKTE